MIDRKRENAARAVLVAAHRRYGVKSFRVDPAGPNWAPLHDAEVLGWVWWVSDDRCAITHAGQCEVEPYRLDMERPVVEWVCPICGTVVPNFQGSTGLPEVAGCPTCARRAGEAAERFRERYGEKGEAAA